LAVKRIIGGVIMSPKQLPKKWEEHIRKMVQFSVRSNEMRAELEEYLKSLGYTNCPSYESGIEFEDSIIDSMLSGDYPGLIDEINQSMEERE
jgi:hypothetical protein